MKVVERLKTSSKWQLGTGALIWVLAQPLLIGWGVSEEVFHRVWITALGIVGVQGVADFGKEAKTP